MTMKDSWDKLLLLVASLAVAGLSALFVVKAFAFGDHFGVPQASRNSELPELDTRPAVAKSFVESSQKWVSPVKGPLQREVDLFLSVPLVESNGVVIDMDDPGAPLLRPPVSNQWLMQNNLDFLNASILDLDSDGDGFTNLEEWHAGTDPNDPSSHPPYAEKLRFLGREQTEYILRFAARPDEERFQIIRLPSARYPGRDTFLMRVGETSADDKFRIESFEEKRARNQVGIEVDASVLTLTYLPKNETVELIRNVDEPIPTYYAEIEFPLDSWKEYVKEGDPFNLVRDPETRYRVLKVDEDSVTIAYQSGGEPEQTVEIKKN